MAPHTFFKDRDVLHRKLDEAAYQAAMEEFQSGNIRTGLMAKAIAQCNGNEALAKATYIQLAAESIKDDLYIAQRSNAPKVDDTTKSIAIYSLIVPGLGQMVQDRSGMAVLHFILAIILWPIFLGWIIHIWSAVDAMNFQNSHQNSPKDDGNG